MKKLTSLVVSYKTISNPEQSYLEQAFNRIFNEIDKLNDISIIYTGVSASGFEAKKEVFEGAKN